MELTIDTSQNVRKLLLSSANALNFTMATFGKMRVFMNFSWKWTDFAQCSFQAPWDLKSPNKLQLDIRVTLGIRIFCVDEYMFKQKDLFISIYMIWYMNYKDYFLDIIFGLKKHNLKYRVIKTEYPIERPLSIKSYYSSFFRLPPPVKKWRNHLHLHYCYIFSWKSVRQTEL